MVGAADPRPEVDISFTSGGWATFLVFSMKNNFIKFISLIFCISYSSIVSANDAVNPDTLKKLREDVELFYQSKPAFARPSRAELAFSPQPTCLQPRYPRAGKFYELEGTALLSFQVDAEGKPKNAHIDKSSRWAILDEAALEALAVCRFDTDQADAWQRRTFVFSID